MEGRVSLYIINIIKLIMEKKNGDGTGNRHFKNTQNDL